MVVADFLGHPVAIFQTLTQFLKAILLSKSENCHKNRWTYSVKLSYRYCELV